MSTAGARKVLSRVREEPVKPWGPYVTPEVYRIGQALFEGLDCARSLTVSLLLKYGEWSQLINLSCNPDQYLTPHEYHSANCATDFLRKFVPAKLDRTSLEAATFEKWLWAERECAKTNLRLSTNQLFSGRFVEAVEILLLAQKKIALWIGQGPNSLDGRFGPGATVSDKSTRTTVLDKMSSVPTLTPSAWRLLVPWSGTKWAHAARGSCLEEVRGNVYFTVPKTGKILRACAKEPSLNVFYQRALGLSLAEKLKKSGIDLTKAKPVHQRWAQAGSRSDTWSTIDMTSASDCLATSLVEWLLPLGWLKYLKAVRSPITEVNGRHYYLEKFSSMGNGYTFELETLVFSGLIAATLEKIGLPAILGTSFRVFGDDIIVPPSSVKAVLAVLKFFGFTANPDKTFIGGSFRESCGGDFFDGVPVRAYYLKEEPNEPHQLVALANGIRRAATCTDGYLDPRFLRAWFLVLDLLPVEIRRCRGPCELGDIVIHDAESKWTIRTKRSIRYIKVYRPHKYRKVKWGWFHPDIQFAASLYGVRLNRLDRLFISGRVFEFSEFEAFIVPRDGVISYKVGWTSFS